MSDFFAKNVGVSSRKLSLELEKYRRWSFFLILSGIFFMLWMFVLFFVPPVIAADVFLGDAYIPFYGPLFVATLCLSAFGLRNLRRAIWIAVFACGMFWLRQQGIFEWWQPFAAGAVFIGLEYLLTHR